MATEYGEGAGMVATRGARGMLRYPPEAFRDALTVRSYEVGRDGVIHPATILRYLEHLATTASAALGFTSQWYRDHDRAFVVREMSLLLGDLPIIDSALTLRTWVAEFRRVQSTRDYLITRADDGRLVARASARWGYIDRARLTPTRIPDELTSVMGPWGYTMRPRAPEPQRSDMPFVSEMRLTARGYEADSQQHINNCVYLDWLAEATTQTAATGALCGQPVSVRPRFYHLEYIRSAQPGDALTIATFAPSLTRSRAIGFWQTIMSGDGQIARAWTEGLMSRGQEPHQ